MRFALIALALYGTLSASAAAQTSRGWDATGLQLTRTELQELLQRYDATAASSSYSGALRGQARAEAELIRERLQQGDLRIGDRVLLHVENRPELTDTFAVVAGRKLVLPDIGEIPLQGVLRSELQAHLAAHVAKFIRDPVVHARSLIRLEVLGAVGRPGFYTMPSDILLTDALMLAGGPATNAKLDGMRIERGGQVIWDGDRMRTARADGRTLDQLSVRAGDRIEVPAQAQNRIRSIQSVIMAIGAITSLFLVGKQVGLY